MHTIKVYTACNAKIFLFKNQLISTYNTVSPRQYICFPIFGKKYVLVTLSRRKSLFLLHANIYGKIRHKIICCLKSANVIVDEPTNLHIRRSMAIPRKPEWSTGKNILSAIFLDTWWFWVDAHDSEGDGIYIESRTGSPLSYSNWSPGEPNLFTSEKCAYMGTLSKRWNNNRCSITVPIICEHTLI